MVENERIEMNKVDDKFRENSQNSKMNVEMMG